MADNDASTARPTPWWGAFELELETGGRWSIGPSTLWLYRTEREWRTIYRPSTDPVASDPMANRSKATVPLPERDMAAMLETDEGDLEIDRYSFQQTEGRIELQPALADHPVVSPPEHPFHVPSRETITSI